MKTSSIFISALALGLVSANVAGAVTEEIRTIESRVVSIPPPPTATTTYSYKVYGPNNTEYVLEGPPSEMQRLKETITVHPETVVRFQGDVVEGPQKVFRLKSWETNTATHTDMWGNKTTTTQTETTTETR